MKLLISLMFLPLLEWGGSEVTGNLQNPALTESSGVVASRRNPGLYWTHNDSGNPPDLFLIDRTGKDLGAWRVTGSTNIDWEDIAIGPGPDRNQPYLYIGDIGDNDRGRTEIVVYRVPEPAASDRRRDTRTATAMRFRYPDRPHDAEALLVHPRTGVIYIVIKARGEDADTLVFKSPVLLPPSGPATLERVAKLDLPPDFDLTAITGRVTGGDISADGRRVILCDYLRAYELVLPEGRPFNEIWKQKFEVIDPGRRPQGEGVAYGPGGRTLLFTSEGVHSPVLEVTQK